MPENGHGGASDSPGFHEKLTEDIIGAAIAVSNRLKPGLDEKLYERALLIELRKRGHLLDQQKSFPVFYDEIESGTLIPDLIVDGAVIAGPKLSPNLMTLIFPR